MPGANPYAHPPPVDPNAPPMPVVQPGAEAPIAAPSQINQDITTQLGMTPSAIQSLAPSAGALPAAERKLQQATDAASGIVQSNAEKINDIASQEITHPSAPTLEQVPSPPDTTPDPHASMRVFGQTLPVLAMLGGLFMQRDATAALNAASSAIEAARTNDHDALAAAHQQWEDSVSAINARNDTLLKQYQAILSDTRMTMDERMSQLQALAAANEDALKLQQLAMGNITGIAQGVSTWANAASTFANAVAAQTRANATTTTWSDDAVTSAVNQMVANGGRIPPNIRNQRVIGQIWDGYAQRLAETGQTAGSQQARAAANRANTNALSDARTRRERAGSAERGMLDALGRATQLSNSIMRSGSPLLNIPINRWGEISGNPELAAFKAAALSAATEYARIIQGSGQATESLTHEAQDMLSMNLTPAQFLAVEDVLKYDAHQRTARMYEEEQSILGDLQTGGISPTVEYHAPTAPAPGAVEGGFRFRGGDPANHANWEPVH